MRRLKLTMTAFGLVLPLALTTATTVGQEQRLPVPMPSEQPQKMDQAAIERSWAIQAELARIEKNPDGFIDALLQSWAPALDNSIYGDFSTELRPLMKAATPWQLYAASLVGDFRGMVQVLRGQVSPGRIVNTLTQPQPRAWTTVGIDALGNGLSSLVFTPIPPCRMVDTRNPGARTGILNPGLPRVFDLTTTGFAKGQGGSASCTGLPSFSFSAWSANITVAGYSDNGGLQAYPFGGSVPSTSIINFFPTAYAIANASTLTGCFGCADDITLLSFGAATHVIVDVMGFYETATGFATGTVTRLAGTLATINAGVFTSVTGGTCPAGTSLIGGAQQNSCSTLVTSDHAFTNGNPPTQWYEFIKNTGASSCTVTVFSMCMDLN